VCVLTFKVLAPVVTGEVITASMLPLVLKLANDSVPNIRFVAARTLGALIPLLDAGVVQQQIKPVLSKLCTDDPDRDVKWHAAEALNSI
jgi:serine/threonine-protein phosphatase 2A regulatory subunit A